MPMIHCVGCGAFLALINTCDDLESKLHCTCPTCRGQAIYSVCPSNIADDMRLFDDGLVNNNDETGVL